MWQSIVQVAGDEAVTIAHVCTTLVTATGVDGVAVTVVAGPVARETVYASNDLAAQLEELALTCGEGPATDALDRGGPVLTADLATPASLASWPGFALAAVRGGVQAVLAFPLRVGGIRLGVLCLYRREPGGLIGEQLADALMLADAVCLLLLDGGDRDAVGTVGGWRPEVHQAAGMISVQLGSGVDVALVRLRAYAYAHDRSLGEVAADVVARRLRFGPEREPS